MSYQLNTGGYTLGTGGYSITPAAGVTVIDDFNAQSLSNYTGETAGFGFNTTDTYEGAAALSCTETDLNIINSTSGLPAYFAKGERIRFYAKQKTEKTISYFYFGLTDGSNNYRLELEFDQDDIDLVSEVAGSTSLISSSASVTYSLDKWYRVEVTWDDGTLGGADNDISIELIDPADDSVLQSTSTNNSDHASATGIGWGCGSSAGSRESLYDYAHKF